MIKRIILACFLLGGILINSVEWVSANVSASTIPDGFYLKLSASGASLYAKKYEQGFPDYVQVISLNQGASIEPLTGDIVDHREGKGVYGGNDPRFTSKVIGDYWDDYAATHENAFCVINGGFFYMKEYPTRLPFPIKKNGVVLSDGYGIKDFVGQKLIFEIWDGHVDIQELSSETLYGSDAPDILGGLTEEANKAASKIVGRTFMGVDDQDGDGQYETVLIFSTKSARQIDAANTLKGFGADKVMMLDGGESAQLICKGETLVESERLLPQAVGISAGSGFAFLTSETPTPDQSEATSDAGKSVATKTPKLNKTKTALAKGLLQGTQDAQESITPTITPTPSDSGYIRMNDVLVVPIALIILAPFLYMVIKRIRSEK